MVLVWSVFGHAAGGYIGSLLCYVRHTCRGRVVADVHSRARKERSALCCLQCVLRAACATPWYSQRRTQNHKLVRNQQVQKKHVYFQKIAQLGRQLTHFIEPLIVRRHWVIPDVSQSFSRSLQLILRVILWNGDVHDLFTDPFLNLLLWYNFELFDTVLHNL